MLVNKFKEANNYHAHRSHRLTKAPKDQKDFSDGYLTFTALLISDDFTVKEKNEILSEQMEIVKNNKHPEFNQAKGFLASMHDFKKVIPKESTIWGNLKTKK